MAWTTPSAPFDITAGETDYEIQLGNYSTMDAQRYVSTGDGNVYLASSDPAELLQLHHPRPHRQR
ncbi:MAG: hypothetical protein V8Q30_14120 [Acutalibacteraceae bacterium]